MESQHEAEDNPSAFKITIDDVKGAISPQDWDTLTLGDDNAAIRCLLRAKIAVKGMIHSAGGKYDEQNEVCKEAVVKRTLYELFAYVGKENRAREKQEDCEILIGAIIKKSDAGNQIGSPIGSMMKSKGNPLARSSREWA
ncbi:MAG: hypothetical protein HDR55_03490 [Treponema sp.]|nr:hypothetical protein [Treponema sp.]